MKLVAPILISGVLLSGLSLASFGLAEPEGGVRSIRTPAELVATYNTLADAILAVKNTEANLVRSILATTHAHAEAQLERAFRAMGSGNPQDARATIEDLADLVAQLGTEGDNAVAGIRKRLVEGGHHHNAEGEKKGIYDEGYVVVTRAAKKVFLEASRAIGRISLSPDRDALEREWKRVQMTWDQHVKGK